MRKLINKYCFWFIIFTFTPTISLAQGSESKQQIAQTAPEQNKTELTLSEKRENTNYILIGVPSLIFLYGLSFWEWGSIHKPRFTKEGYFGQDTADGGADKLGHLFSMYCITRLSHDLFLTLDIPKQRSLAYSAGLSLFTGIMIEAGDSFSNYGFSYEDIIFDFTGTSIAYLLGQYKFLDQLVGLSVEYFPSEGFRDNFNGKIFTDYSGITYLLNVRLAGIQQINKSFLKYIQLDAAYKTRGFKEYDKPYYNEKFRFLSPGISLNVPEVITKIIKNGSFYKKFTAEMFRYYHLRVGLYYDVII